MGKLKVKYGLAWEIKMGEELVVRSRIEWRLCSVEEEVNDGMYQWTTEK